MKMRPSTFNKADTNIQDVSQALLSQLTNVKELSPGKFMAACPSHLDTRPSLAITEADDRLLLHCWAGCRTSDILMAVGLDYTDIFVASCINSRTRRPPAPSRWPDFPWDPLDPPHLPFRWNWRRQCAQLECLIQAQRDQADAILAATQGLNIHELTTDEFDGVMLHVGRAHAWLDRCDRLDGMLFYLQQTLRAEEQDAKRLRKSVSNQA